MKTLLTIKQQNEFLSENWVNKTFEHKWSNRGMGNSKILDGAGNIIGKAGGCGYDRFGAALGVAIMTVFPEEVLKIAKSKCKGKRRTYKQASDFYGMFYNSVDKKAWLDGACGSDCMIKVLNKIGFSLLRVGKSEQSNSGNVFYTLTPITKHERKYL